MARKPALTLVTDTEGAPRRTKIRGPALANGLTAKQEAFAQFVSEGLPLSEAYRRAYEAGNMRPSSVWNRASVLFDDTKVKQRVDELLAERERSALHDRRRATSWIFENLKAIAENSDTDGARVSAIQTVARMHALLTDRTEAEVTDTASTAQMREELAQALALLANPPRQRA